MPGPFYKIYGGDGEKMYARRIWYTQSKPYHASLPYQYEESHDLIPYGSPDFLGAVNYSAPLVSQSPALVSALENRLRDKFVAKLGDSSLWAVNLIEAKQSITMIQQRSIQIVSFVRALKKLDFVKASKVLGVTTPKGVSRKRQVSNNFLEYHFGWSPLVQDIGAAVNTLQNPIPQRRVKVRVLSNVSDRFPPAYPRPGTQNNRASQEVVSLRAGARVVISNPDLYLANQLGFTNPAAVAWEVVPFSFVVDWFLPVGNFLSGMTAFLGVTLNDPYTSSRSFRFSWTRGTDMDGIGKHDYVGWGVVASRSNQAISPFPHFVPSLGFSPMRAVTAMALLTQNLRSIR